jgi:diacylglycerol kinase
MMFIVARAGDNQELQDVFRLIDDLATNLILVIVAITLGLFVTQYLYVLVGLVGAMALVVMVPALNSALNLSVEYVLACGLVCLGFSAISNIYANYRGIE